MFGEAYVPEDLYGAKAESDLTNRQNLLPLNIQPSSWV